jgi:hypothetical protein
MSTAGKLIVLGKLEGYIRFMARRTYVKNLCMDFDDLVQEGRLKALSIMAKYPDSPTSEVISLCIKSLSNLYGCIIRKSKLERNSGIIIDLSEAFSISDKDAVGELFLNLQIRQLYDLMDGDEVRILDCIIDPPEELVSMAVSKYSKFGKSEVKITRDILSKFLGISKSELRELFNGIRIKAIPVIQ